MGRPEHHIRKTVKDKHGDQCYVCGVGPLTHRGLHIVVAHIHIAFEAEEYTEDLVPCCTECAAWAEAGSDGRPHLDRGTIRALVRKFAEVYSNAYKAGEKMHVPVPVPKAVVPLLDPRYRA